MNFKNLLSAYDGRIAASCLRVKSEKGVLLSFLFHSLFENKAEAQSGVMDPQQGITVEMFRSLVRHFHSQSYSFVSPDQLAGELSPGGRYMLLTFDDGYFNNVRALPVLEEFNVPAVFFISSNHVKYNKSFWWDAVYREGKQRQLSSVEIGRTIGGYKKLKTEDVEGHLKKKIGPNALRPATDVDRPFTPSELRVFSNHPLVSLGNHTKDHAILPNYSEAEIRRQICDAQIDILEMTGRMPNIIAYPSGVETPEVRRAAENAGLALGIGIRPGRNQLPLGIDSLDRMALKRFTLRGDCGIEAQCLSSRSRVSIYRLIQDLKRIASRKPFRLAGSLQ